MLLLSCSSKYLAYKDKYMFRSSDGKPDYSNLNYWAAHPWKWDPSDSLPATLNHEKKDSSVDVFFLHPTMYTKGRKDGSMNADIDDYYLNAKTDYSTILYQASVFNQHARVFAPRFREAHISAYFIKDREKALAAFDLAYQDIKTAFEYYLANHNAGRPLIIASHSQGSTHAIRLMAEYFANKPLQKQLVVAYIIGMGIPEEKLNGLRVCRDSTETGCLVGWRTLRRGYRPSYIKSETGNYLVTNPLTWQTDSEYAPRSLNQGSVLRNFSKIYRYTTDARIEHGVIWVRKPRFPLSFLYFKKNYHIGDINLYYINLRRNVETRIRSFNKN